MIVLLALVACASDPPPPAPAPVLRDDLVTAAGRYRVSWSTSPEDIPLAGLFSVVARVVDAQTGAPVEAGTVHIDASMPQHGHGMPTRPEDDPGLCTPTEGGAPSCSHPRGEYRTRGMKFHMPGAWTLRFDIEGPAGVDRLEVQVPL